MRIGIIDADLLNSKRNRFPNLACMKLSAFHKQGGHEVRLLTDYTSLKAYDKVFISKVFTETKVPEEVLPLPNVEYGGTGFFWDKAPALPDEIEHIMPDYHLYEEFVRDAVARGEMPKQDANVYLNYSIGYTTRGCIRQCDFCVNHSSRRSVVHSPVAEVVDPTRKYIFLLDDNVLACSDWRRIFNELNATGKHFCFRQGLDARLLTPEKCEVIFGSNWKGDFIFAFDNIADRAVMERKLKLIQQYKGAKQVKMYLLCGFNHDQPGVYTEEFWLRDVADLFERIRIVLAHECVPYAMRYADYAKAPQPYKGIYITLARYCNQPSIAKKKSFRQYCYETVGQNESAPRYASAFAEAHPNVAERYYDVRWGDPL